MAEFQRAYLDTVWCAKCRHRPVVTWMPSPLKLGTMSQSATRASIPAKTLDTPCIAATSIVKRYVLSQAHEQN